MVSIRPKHTETGDPRQQLLACLAWPPKQASPCSCRAQLQTRSIVSFQWPILFAESRNGASSFPVDIPAHFSAVCLVLPSSPQPTGSLKQPTAFVWIYRVVMARVQTRVGRISGGPASSYSAKHNLLVILLGTSDSDVTLLQPGSWWDQARRTKRIMPAPTESRRQSRKPACNPHSSPGIIKTTLPFLVADFHLL